jgi:hypothetical protein
MHGIPHGWAVYGSIGRVGWAREDGGGVLRMLTDAYGSYGCLTDLTDLTDT